jgi:hypothetical protein
MIEVRVREEGKSVVRSVGACLRETGINEGDW